MLVRLGGKFTLDVVRKVQLGSESTRFHSSEPPKTMFPFLNNAEVENLFKEFEGNLKEVSEKNRWTNADYAHQFIERNIITPNRLSSLDYFRGIHAVTEAFINTPGASTPENRKALSSFMELIRKSRIASNNKNPLKIAITGASGKIAYALISKIASGQMFGPLCPVELHLLENPQSLDRLEGVQMELEDCVFSLLRQVKITSSTEEAFEDADFVILLDNIPHQKSIDSSDYLIKNAEIFSACGKALDKTAKKTVHTLVVGDPANTNCLVVASNAKKIPSENFTALTRLDHNRALSQLAKKIQCPIADISCFAVWGNQISTQHPDITHAFIKDRPVSELVDQEWIENVFIPSVQNRGNTIAELNGLSFAESTANAIVDHIRDWTSGSNGKWSSMAVVSGGDYGVAPEIYYSFPVVSAGGSYDIVSGLQIDEFTADRLEKSHKELLNERDRVAQFLK